MKVDRHTRFNKTPNLDKELNSVINQVEIGIGKVVDDLPPEMQQKDFAKFLTKNKAVEGNSFYPTLKIDGQYRRMYVDEDSLVFWATDLLAPDIPNGTVLISDSMGSSGGAMVYKLIKATGQAEGDLHLSGSGWVISKAHISQIRVITSSTDWDLWILQNDNGYSTNDANVPALKLMEGGNGEETIEHDFNYQDEDASNEVHLYAVDNVGSATFDFYIKGVELL